jgi:hypothetical protein
MTRTLGRADATAGRDTYHALGELTADDFAYLAGQSSDTARRRTLANWYGRAGGAYAWVQYRAAQRRSGANRR